MAVKVGPPSDHWVEPDNQVVSGVTEVTVDDRFHARQQRFDAFSSRLDEQFPVRIQGSRPGNMELMRCALF
jgi:hypothetical protein